MKFLVGTSGYSYKEWKGTFYPAKLPAKQMLAYYATQLPTVEINSTFRRFPTDQTVKAWAADTPESFRFVLKARQTITHFRRLVNAEEQIDDFIHLAALLGKRQGPLLFQLPPNFKKDLPRLEAFFEHVAGRAAIVLQLQHESWFDDDVYACLRKYKAALCAAEADDRPLPQLVRTADWGYVRLREEKYTKPQLAKWIERIRSQEWREVFVFFKHEDAAAGPALARRFQEMAEAGP
jgi:uncharacterized protein YecE (DUF72 family)